ncbi:unnamed protein product [Moneuplotes crassus]|uniref:Uncharacterized protein n=1 Tax=Euplotes crassus TaxID=5936 RepID=A0AAD1UGM1_EUPCR|nr:unnamed protein product [Moneuplotes crassus]
MSFNELDFCMPSPKNATDDESSRMCSKGTEERFADALRGSNHYIIPLEPDETMNSFDNFLSESSPEEAAVEEPVVKKIPDLSQRKDVLFKSIFRSVKKYYTKLFKESSDFYKHKSEKAKKANVKACVKNFIQKDLLFLNGSEGFHSVEIDELCEFMSRIIAPKSCTKSYTTYSCKKYINLLYKCIYNYNERNAAKLYTSEVMKHIFFFCLREENLEKMVQEDPNLARNSKLIKEKAKEVLDGFRSI